MEGTSARIGEKLLAGWTLLAEHCPRAGCAAPLLRSRDAAGQLYCPQHDGVVEAAAELAASKQPASVTFDEDAHADQRLGPFARHAGAAKAAPEPEPPLPSSRGGSAGGSAGGVPPPPHVSSERQVALTAEYLLNGWTMLAETCPVEGCHAPLMWRKAERRKFCPAHQLWVLTEQQAALESSAAQPPPQAAPLPERTVVTPATPPAPAQPVAAAAAAAEDVVVVAAVTALRTKISEATEALAGPQKLLCAQALVSLIKECAAAITALRAM